MLVPVLTRLRRRTRSLRCRLRGHDWTDRSDPVACSCCGRTRIDPGAVTGMSFLPAA